MNQGIPGLPDLTQPQTLLRYGEQVLHWGQGLLVLLVAIGLVLAAIVFAYRGARPDWLPPLGDRYSQLLQGTRRGILIAILVITGFLLCSTLANRYHHWEQAKIAQVAGSVAGERVEQPAPLVRYTVMEPYTTITYTPRLLILMVSRRRCSGNRRSIASSPLANPKLRCSLAKQRTRPAIASSTNRALQPCS